MTSLPSNSAGIASRLRSQAASISSLQSRPESLPGDEPEPLPQVRWPLAQLMSLLDEEDFNEARNVSALFLVREWLQAQGRL